MDAIGLDRVWNANQILIEHGHKRSVITGGDRGKDSLEGADEVRAVIGRQRDACHQHLNMSVRQRTDHLVEVGAGLPEGQAAQTVVAAELDDDDGRVQAEDEGQAGDCVLGGGSACALVDDLVMVAVIVENLL